MSLEIDVKVTPRSSQEKIEAQADGSLRIWVRAAPTDGQANEAICKLIAKKAGVSKTSVVVISGQSSRQKRIHIEGLEPSEAKKRLF